MKQVMPTFLLSLLIVFPPPSPVAEEHDPAADMAVTGPHGGRLLESGAFAVELRVFEDGVDPQFRAWAFMDGEEIPARQWDLTVALTRLGGRVDQFSFTAIDTDNFRLGDGIVGEPHSFDISINATYRGQSYRFNYESYEGRIEMPRTVAERMGVGTAVAKPATLHRTLRLYGSIQPDPGRISHIKARYPGIINNMELRLGDRVERGDLIATIQANDSLQSYEIHAPISGLVVDIHANPGELAANDSLLTIADYQTVWASLHLFPEQALQVRPGQAVTLQAGDRQIHSSIRFLNPGEGQTPYVLAKAPLNNSDGIWTPGLLVEGEVTISEIGVGLAVDNRALQQFRDWQVVFIRLGDTYEIRPLELGRGDSRYTEVLGGLNTGDEYVVENSYLLKADLEKSGAAHSH